MNYKLDRTNNNKTIILTSIMVCLIILLTGTTYAFFGGSSSNKIDEFLTTNNIKTIVDYVKKINPDTISKTLNTIQKVLQITQSFGAKQPPGLYNANYNSWWD